MQNLIQIIYISRSTFESTESVNGIEPNVARILMKSRTNNREKGLVGVLYFGDGCFYQCLEGEAKVVDTLYAKLLEDDRHKDLKILSRKAISALSFSDWAMKYVPLESKMMSLLQLNGYKKFDPYLFNEDMINSVLNLLHKSNDSSAKNATESVVKKIDQLNDAEPDSFPFGKLTLGLLAIFVAFSLYVILGK